MNAIEWICLFAAVFLAGFWLGTWNYSRCLRFYVREMKGHPKRGMEGLEQILMTRR